MPWDIRQRPLHIRERPLDIRERPLDSRERPLYFRKRRGGVGWGGAFVHVRGWVGNAVIVCVFRFVLELWFCLVVGSLFLVGFLLNSFSLIVVLFRLVVVFSFNSCILPLQVSGTLVYTL